MYQNKRHCTIEILVRVRGRDSKKETADRTKFLVVADILATAMWIDRTATRTRANDRVPESTSVHSLLRGRENRTHITTEYSSVAPFRQQLAWRMSVIGPDISLHDTVWNLVLYSASAVCQKRNYSKVLHFLLFSKGIKDTVFQGNW